MKKIIALASLLAIVGFLWVLLEFVLGYHDEKIADHSSFTNFALLPVIIALVAGLRALQKSEGYTTFGPIFKAGVLASLISGVLGCLAFWIYVTLVNPAFFRTFIDFTVRTGQFNKPQAEAYFSLANYFTLIAIGNTVVGIVVSLLAAWILPRVFKR